MLLNLIVQPFSQAPVMAVEDMSHVFTFNSSQGCENYTV